MINKGFTLIEMVVALAIMAILATITIASFSNGNKSRRVELAADSLESGVRTAQDLSLNPKSVATISCSLSSVPAEYHVVFSTSASSVMLAAIDRCGNAPITLGHYDILEGTQIKKSDGLKVDSTSAGSGGGSLEIEYFPPFGKAKASLNGGPYADFTQATVVLESTDSTISKTLVIDGISGRVEIK